MHRTDLTESITVELGSFNNISCFFLIDYPKDIVLEIGGAGSVVWDNTEWIHTLRQVLRKDLSTEHHCDVLDAYLRDLADAGYTWSYKLDKQVLDMLDRIVELSNDLSYG